LKEVGKGFREKGEEGEKAQRASSGTQILKSGAEEIDLLQGRFSDSCSFSPQIKLP